MTLSEMNLFLLDVDPRKNASFHFDKHCVKMILELAQMLYCAHWLCGITDWGILHRGDTGTDPYRKTHINHPTSKWVRSHPGNYLYTAILGLELCYEYTRRYGREHKTQLRLEWLLVHLPNCVEQDFPGFLATRDIPTGCTPMPLAMPEQYHQTSAVASYRAYYLGEKRQIQDKIRTADWLAVQWQLSFSQ